MRTLRGFPSPDDSRCLKAPRLRRVVVTSCRWSVIPTVVYCATRVLGDSKRKRASVLSAPRPLHDTNHSPPDLCPPIPSVRLFFFFFFLRIGVFRGGRAPRGVRGPIRVRFQECIARTHLIVCAVRLFVDGQQGDSLHAVATRLLEHVFWFFFFLSPIERHRAPRPR